MEQAMNELYPFISDSPLSLVHLDYIPIGVNKYDYIYSSCCFIVLMPLVRDLNTLKRIGVIKYTVKENTRSLIPMVFVGSKLPLKLLEPG